MPAALKTIQGDDLLFGTLLFLGKSAPSARLRANVYMRYNVATGRIIKPTHLEPTITKVSLMLNGRMEEDTITNVIE